MTLTLDHHNLGEVTVFSLFSVKLNPYLILYAAVIVASLLLTKVINEEIKLQQTPH